MKKQFLKSLALLSIAGILTTAAIAQKTKTANSQKNTKPETSVAVTPTITFSTDPKPAKGAAQNTLHVSVIDKSGKPVRDAEVKVEFLMAAMPAMNMGEMRNSTNLKWNGTDYSGPLNIMMAGTWNVTVDVSRNGKRIAEHKTQVEAK